MKHYNRIRYTLPAIALLCLTACGDSPRITNTPPSGGVSPKPDPTDYYVSPSCSECKTEVLTEEGAGADGILGHGYDVTGSYLSSSSLRPSVVNLRKLKEKDLVTAFSAPASSIGEIISGRTPGAFLSSLMAGCGFSTSASDNTTCFNATLNSLSSNASYILSNNWIRSEIVKINHTSRNLIENLSDEFIADTARLKPNALVAKYGTHLLVSTSLGVSVRTLYGAYVDAPSSEKVDKAYDGYLFSEQALADKLAPELSVALESVGNYGATLTKTFSGGDLSLIEYDPKTGKLGSSDAWQQSASSGNLALITLGENDLCPLSKAIKDPTLALQVDRAAANYIRDSKVAAEATLPLLQNSNGKTYRYVTSYDESLKLADNDGLKFYGILGSIYRNKAAGSIPLYSHVSADGTQILSLIQPTDNWERLGYVMKERTANTVSLYEISDGSRFAYTIEAANSYGPHNEWHPTGAVFYLLRP